MTWLPQNACASPTPRSHQRKVAAVFAGIDTYKDTVAVAVIDDACRLVAAREVPNTEQGFAQLVGLFDTHRVVRVGIEGSGNLGRAVVFHLSLCWQIDRDLNVVEVPILMTPRERCGQLGKGKTDPVDALAIAPDHGLEQQLLPVRLTIGAATDLRALLDYREDLIEERRAGCDKTRPKPQPRSDRAPNPPHGVGAADKMRPD
jgi:transposase